jgi:hypothetical protein
VQLHRRDSFSTPTFVMLIHIRGSANFPLTLKSLPALTYSHTRNIFISPSPREGRPAGRFSDAGWVRRLRAGLVTSLPGGSGNPLGRHYDRSARTSLDWDRLKRVTPAKTTSQERRPGAEARAFTLVPRAAMERRTARASSLDALRSRRRQSDAHFASACWRRREL